MFSKALDQHQENPCLPHASTENDVSVVAVYWQGGTSFKLSFYYYYYKMAFEFFTSVT